MFPPLYVVLDWDLLQISPIECAESLASSGVELMQYRAKHATAREYFETSNQLVKRLARNRVRLIVNDRPDVAAITGAGGVHVGQDDLPPEAARRICGPGLWLGVSTHNLEQVRAASLTSADYIAVGPVFATSTKENPDRVVGTSFIREARKLTTKPIVAIGGITLERAVESYEAGADSVAVISDILLAPDPVARAQDFLRVAQSFFQNTRAKP